MISSKMAHLFVFAALALTASPVPSEAARILAIMSVQAKSHHIFFSSLTSALAARGHHVHSIDIQMPKLQPPTLNVTLLDPFSQDDIARMSNVTRVFNNGTVLEKVRTYLSMSTNLCEATLKTRVIQDIISPNFKKEFDLILLNYVCHECLLGFIHRFNYVPTIVAAPFPKPAAVYRTLGNPLYHGIPHFFVDYPLPMGYPQRLVSLVMYAVEELLYYLYVEPNMEAIARRHFGDDVPSVKELSKHVALGLVNLMDTSARPPLIPNIIPVGGMHIQQAQPLEKKLKDFLDGAKDGAVLMSFGTVVRGDTMGTQKRDAVLRMFSRLPQRLVWKYEIDNKTSIPSNVMILPWVPQNDVLDHPNMRLFVSHCGGLSSIEAAYHGVPVLGVPYMVDQHANAEQVVSSGTGLKLSAEEMTEETLYAKVTELLNNPKYYNTAQKMRSIMQDQLVKPLDRAVFYVEYVLRQKGAPHLRSPIVDLHFRTHTLLIDIVSVTAILMITLIIFLAVSFKIVRCLWRCVRRAPKTQTRVDLNKKKKN